MASLEGGADRDFAGYRQLLLDGQAALEATSITPEAEGWQGETGGQSADQAYGTADFDITATEEDDQEDHAVGAVQAGGAAAVQASVEQPAVEPEPPVIAEQAASAEDVPADQAPAAGDSGSNLPPPPPGSPVPSASDEEPPEDAHDDDRSAAPPSATRSDAVAGAEGLADTSGADVSAEPPEPEAPSPALPPPPEPKPEPPRPLTDRIRGWFSRDKPVPAAVEPPADKPAAQDPDGPYAQEDLITFSIAGDTAPPTEVPAADVLDLAHTAIRMAELVDQAENPRPPEVRIPQREIPGHAFELLSSVQDAVADWEPGQEDTDPSSGVVIRNYSKTVAGEGPDSRPTFHTVQLVYNDEASTVPVSGSVFVDVPVHGWLRTYHFQASPVAREHRGAPKIYYNDYPFHEETLGRPERNTVYGLEQARRLVSILPRGQRPDATQDDEQDIH